MKYLIIALLLMFVSCSKEKNAETKQDPNCNSSTDVKDTAPVVNVEVKVAWKRTFPPGRKVHDYAHVNPNLASKIIHALKQEGEAIKDLPELRETILKVESKESASKRN